MTYYIRDSYTIVRRHWILILFEIIKFIFFLAVSLIIFWIAVEYKENISRDIELYIMFPIIFSILNYAFLKLINSLIIYYNELLLVYDDKIILIKCSLILRDDIEIIDAYRVMKIDAFTRGLIWNLLSYGNLVIEQQKDEVRIFHFISQPYRILEILKKQREKVKIESKKKYIVSSDKNDYFSNIKEKTIIDKVWDIIK